MSTATTTEAEEDQAAAAALLARLQAQFGDMDVQGMLTASHPEDTASNDGNGASPNSELQDDVRYESDESSIVEPTPEELAAWQQAQYKLAKWGREASSLDKDGATSGDGTDTEAMSAEQLTEWIQVEGPPSLDGQESAFLSAKSDDPMLKALSRHEPLLNGPWQRLYASNTDGLSYAGLVSALRGYEGPTVLLIGAIPPPAAAYAKADGTGGGQKTTMIGYYTATPWKESGSYYGNKNCFLFTPSGVDDDEEEAVQIFGPISKTSDETSKKSTRPTNYQFCHSTIAAAVVSDGRKPGQHPDDANAKGKSVVQVPPGLGVGESRGIGPRLYITQSLEGCRALPYDDTFVAGPLLPPFFGDNPTHSFDVDVIEAWGVGGSERIQRALAARNRDRSYKEASRRRNAEVDRAQFVDHFKSDVVD